MNVTKFSLHIEKERHWLHLQVLSRPPVAHDHIFAMVSGHCSQPLAGMACSFRGSGADPPPTTKRWPLQSSAAQQDQDELKMLS